MRTKTITLYQYDELSEAAKAKARDWYRGLRDSSDLESIIEDADRMLGMLGITLDRRDVRLMGGGTRHDPKIWWTLGYCQSDGVWINGRYAYQAGAHKAIRAEAPEDRELHAAADALLELQRRYQYQLSARFSHDDRSALNLELEHPTREVDEATYDTMREILRDLERWIYNVLRTEDEYQSGDEVVADTIRANEYEFHENGGRA